MKRLTLRNILFVGLLLLVLLPSCGMPDDPLSDLYTMNVYPGSDSTYDIGATGNEYANIYVDDLYVVDDLDVGDDVDIGGTLSVNVITGQNIQVTGKVEADRLIGDVEGYSIDVVQASNLDIVLNDTLILTFLFEPDIIVLDYSSRCMHDTTSETGHSTGHCVIERTAVDTISSNTNMTALIDSNGAVGSVSVQDDVNYPVIAYGGYNGATDSYFFGEASWVSATHTLTITFSTVANTNTAFNFVEMVATAYR